MRRFELRNEPTMYLEGIDKVINGMIVLLCVFVPLGIWKLIDIAIWLFSHISVRWN